LKPRSDSETEQRRGGGRRLTDRQSQILGLVAEGLENKEIGHRLGLTEQAVKEHVSALLRRLAVRNRAALAESATELKIAGTLDLPPHWLGYIYDKSPVASAVVKGSEHVYVAANAAYRRAAGVDDIVGRRMIDVFPNASAATLAALSEVVATGRAKILHELPGRWYRDGVMSDGFVDVIWQPLPGTEGGVIIWGLDVTEQVRARHSMAELSAEQLAMFDLVPSGIVVLDRSGLVVKVNRAAQELIGAGPFRKVGPGSAEEFRLRDAATGRAVPSVEGLFRRVLDGETVRDLRFVMFLPGLGHEALVRVDAELVRTAAGEPRAVVATLTQLVEQPAPV
jgi:DNA-binding CsgD family transcriptional regulator